MKRILLFVLTNLAIMVTLMIVLSVLGVTGYVTPMGSITRRADGVLPGLGLRARKILTKDKTLTFIVGYSPGGTYDQYTRLIARHIGKYLPGNPQRNRREHARRRRHHCGQSSLQPSETGRTNHRRLGITATPTGSMGNEAIKIRWS